MGIDFIPLQIIGKLLNSFYLATSNYLYYFLLNYCNLNTILDYKSMSRYLNPLTNNFKFSKPPKLFSSKISNSQLFS